MGARTAHPFFAITKAAELATKSPLKYITDLMKSILNGLVLCRRRNVAEVNRTAESALLLQPSICMLIGNTRFYKNKPGRCI